MKWNLRMRAAQASIWKSTEMRRRLADAGLEISAGKMSALWTGTPTTIRLDDLDVICAVLNCTPADLLICEPDKVAAQRPPAGGDVATGPRQRRGWVGTLRCRRHEWLPPRVRGVWVRPPAMREIPYCFDCWPGGPVTPPPCYKCGATDRYYASGLCARCHPHAPGQLSPAGKRAGPLAQQRVVIDSCPDCDAWGVTRTYGWVCMGCKSWRETHQQRAACATCRRVAALGDDGSCRLCHKQRSHYARRIRVRPSKVSLVKANRDGQQFVLRRDVEPQTGHRQAALREDHDAGGHDAAAPGVPPATGTAGPAA